MKKMKKTVVFSMTFVMLTTGVNNISVSAASIADMSVNTTVKDTASVKMTWSKHSVDGYEIYREEYDEAEDEYISTCIADVDGDLKTYTDTSTEEETHYYYTVKGYVNSHDDRKYLYQAKDIDVYTGLSEVWKGSIKNVSGGVKLFMNYHKAQCMTPTGVWIYRKEAGGSYKRIASRPFTDDDKKGLIAYKDTKVTAGNTYKYKVKLYKTINGTNKVGETSDAVSITYRNSIPQITGKLLTKEGNQSTISYSVTSNKGNYTVSIPTDSIIKYESKKYSTSSKKVQYLKLVSYSTDNKSWKSYTSKTFPKTIDIASGNTVYLKYMPCTGDKKLTNKKFLFKYSGYNKASITQGIEYNKKTYNFDIQFNSKNNKVTVY